MSHDFEIRLEAIATTVLGTVEGRIAVRLGDLWFPGESWSDLPVPVLLGWTEILTTEAAMGEVHFLDGPYLLKLARTAWDNWLIEAVRGGRHRQVVRSLEVPEISILRELRDALAALQSYERGATQFDGTDSKRVRTGLDQVRRILRLKEQ